MNTEKVMEALRRVEWVGRLHKKYCPWCGDWESQGHMDGYELAALLSEGRAVVGPGGGHIEASEGREEETHLDVRRKVLGW